MRFPLTSGLLPKTPMTAGSGARWLRTTGNCATAAPTAGKAAPPMAGSSRPASRLFGNNPCLHALTSLEQSLQWRLRTTRKYDELFARLKPDLVFNGSHIHGAAGELPLRVAQRMGIPTAGFIFSWDNLTSRSRIMVPYDYWFVWHEGMKRQLLSIYPRIQESNVFVTGTPQIGFPFPARVRPAARRTGSAHRH